jgi:hypothetical protein
VSRWIFARANTTKIPAPRSRIGNHDLTDISKDGGLATLTKLKSYLGICLETWTKELLLSGEQMYSIFHSVVAAFASWSEKVQLIEKDR